jgi:hypothetical protein
MPVLECLRVTYCSQNDEKAFFEWVGRIRCVTSRSGAGDTLCLHVRQRRIPDGDLRDLLALFTRYRIGMKQLAQFESDGNRSWFTDPEKYWHTRVFGGGAPGRTQRRGSSMRNIMRGSPLSARPFYPDVDR